MDDLVAAVREMLADETLAEFDRRVAEQAEQVAADVASGELDNPDFAVGMELEAYVVDADGRLCVVPDDVFEIEGCDEELGDHNLEIHTPPDTLDADGLARQAETIRHVVASARAALGESDCRLVLDGMWSVPPPAGTRTYLGAVEERDGVTVAENMREDARYVALDDEIRDASGGSIPLSVPGFSGEFPSILLESLATSIQPHCQIPDASAFPSYFDVALRTTGPVLALTSNSPFLPSDLYAFDDASGAPGDELEPRELVDATHHELRIQAFEQSINAGLPAADRKVRFPRDVESTRAVVDRLVRDETYAPFLSEADWREADYGDRYPELAHKRGTYWRWVRGVVGGQRPRESEGTEASVRIEYRPLPTQPTAADVVACQALVCGLLRGLVAADHPLADLPWEAARDTFYAAAETGLDADLAWVTADGVRTENSETVFGEVFEYARRGLALSDLPDGRIDGLLAPLEARWAAGTAPSDWKKEQVRAALSAGRSFDDALATMQERYVRLAREHETFADWL